MKKKGWIILAVVVVVVLMLFSWFKGTYNDMVARSEAVQAQLGNIENQYQRRADLIPNLVNTVKGYAKHEESTFTQVVEARAKATQTQLNIDDAAAMDKYVQAQGELSSALSRLMAISENYPDLKANQNFLDLQTQLEGTENRIAASTTNRPVISILILKCSRVTCFPECSVSLRWVISKPRKAHRMLRR